MTKRDLIDAVQAHYGDVTKKQIGEIVDSVFTNVVDSIQNDGRFYYPGFGTFKFKARAARKGRNPQTGAEITIQAKNTVTFTAAPNLDEILNTTNR